MEIKKGHIIAALLLLAAIAGTGAVYQFYVKERMSELQQHLEEEEKLEERIKELESTFYGAKPEVVLSAWRRQTQPWAEAVEQRSRFFNLGSVSMNRDIPQEVIPKFYYADEYPKMMRRLRNLAAENNTYLGNIGFGVPQPDSQTGQNPSRKQVEEWLTRLEFGMSVARMLIDANAQSIEAINIWPPRDGPSGRRGKVEFRTTGIRMTMQTKDLVEFLDDLISQTRYFSVDGIWMYKTSLRNSYAPLNVEMLLTQARYIEGAGGGGDGGPALDEEGAASTFENFFQSRAAQNRRDQQQEEPSWWQRFIRGEWLPF